MMNIFNLLNSYLLDILKCFRPEFVVTGGVFITVCCILIIVIIGLCVSMKRERYTPTDTFDTGFVRHVSNTSFSFLNKCFILCSYF